MIIHEKTRREIAVPLSSITHGLLACQFARANQVLSLAVNTNEVKEERRKKEEKKKNAIAHRQVVQ